LTNYTELNPTSSNLIDLNNLLDPGIYVFDSYNNGQNRQYISNFPASNGSFEIIVEKRAFGSGYIIQTFKEFSTSDNSIYKRVKSGYTWESW